MKITPERQKMASDNLHYSDRRIDLLLISISGGGIYVCMETIKYLSTNTKEIHWLIWLAGIGFLITIITNFIGQFIGRAANHNDYLWCDAMLEKQSLENKTDVESKRHKEDLKNEIEEYDRLSDNYSRAISPINIFSTLSMIVGLASILSYFLKYFISS
ncbi:hypothetical protein [uncultured Draconibacterium sp.]|uniref:hypothetical protein n=1 Tax=uncultured Draconibacterium sp. TaxID=1573823 RepID=UPI0032178F67